MGRYKRYSKELKIKIAKEAALPEHERCEHIIADKYGVMPWTVEKWRALYLEYGEMGLPSKCKPGLKFPFIYIHRYEHRVARMPRY